MIRLLFTVLVLTSALADDCAPLYWEINPNYKVVTNEVETYSKFQLLFGSVNTTVIENATKITYALNEITVKQSYDGSRVVVNGNGTGLISVNNNLINMSFSYNANSNCQSYSETGSISVKAYNGVGTAVIDKMQVNFTKKLVYKDGQATFELAKLNYNLPNAVVPGKFVPEPTAKENTTFFNLATDNMYQQVRNVIDIGLNITLSNILANESFSNPFGGESYNYSYGTLRIPFSSHMNNVSFLEQGGLLVGYNMSIIGGDPVCGSPLTPDPRTEASFVTIELIKSIFDYATQFNKDWNGMKLDYTNTKSDVFQFYMIDLEDILPKALIDYPSLLTRIEARCSILPDSTSLILDTVYSLVRATASWSCDLYISGTSVKLLSNQSVDADVQPKVGYEVRLTQEGNVIRSTVSNIMVSGVDFNPEDYPLQNQKLAILYVKSVAASMGNFNTLGTGFVQPVRRAPKFQWNANFLRIYDTVRSLRVE